MLLQLICLRWSKETNIIHKNIKQFNFTEFSQKIFNITIHVLQIDISDL